MALKGVKNGLFVPKSMVWHRDNHSVMLDLVRIRPSLWKIAAIYIFLGKLFLYLTKKIYFCADKHWYDSNGSYIELRSGTGRNFPQERPAAWSCPPADGHQGQCNYPPCIRGTGNLIRFEPSYDYLGWSSRTFLNNHFFEKCIPNTIARPKLTKLSETI